jgi:hypothetical protein
MIERRERYQSDYYTDAKLRNKPPADDLEEAFVDLQVKQETDKILQQLKNDGPEFKMAVVKQLVNSILKSSEKGDELE